ncbi:hypothetical protein DENSPDRAFT_220538 [Dentipellis sp. KUC8613]|nr:hypothetical protein DENSPDRAFT_220538 [Dentipellis sp. KUC8613]
MGVRRIACLSCFIFRFRLPLFFAPSRPLISSVSSPLTLLLIYYPPVQYLCSSVCVSIHVLAPSPLHTLIHLIHITTNHLITIPSSNPQFHHQLQLASPLHPHYPRLDSDSDPAPCPQTCCLCYHQPLPLPQSTDKCNM